MKTTTRTVLCIALLALASVSLFAQAPGVMTINGGKMTVSVKPVAHYVPAERPPAALHKVYDNLGTGTSVYNCCSGWTISAVGSVIGAQNWVANGFTPKKNYTLAKIQVGVGYVTGTNSVAIGLAEDKGGVPGKVLKHWDAKTGSLPTFGNCCQLVSVSPFAKKPITLTKGKQYWVLVYTDKNSPDTWDAWNLDTGGQTGPFSNNTGSGWVNLGTGQQGAFAVWAH